MIVDSSMSFAEAIAGTAAPPGVIETLCLVEVRYRGFDGKPHQGQMVLHKDLREDLQSVFSVIEDTGFRIAKAIPVVRYGWSDDRSMANNNSSAFNYRFVAGTERLSLHANGRAVDINPLQNPVIYRDGRSAPPGAVYNTAAEGTFSETNPVVLAFRARGWRWGGDFDHVHDYHHFEKT